VYHPLVYLRHDRKQAKHYAKANKLTKPPRPLEEGRISRNLE
jgi:hypothetical protein